MKTHEKYILLGLSFNLSQTCLHHLKQYMYTNMSCFHNFFPHQSIPSLFHRFLLNCPRDAKVWSRVCGLPLVIRANPSPLLGFRVRGLGLLPPLRWQRRLGGVGLGPGGRQERQAEEEGKSPEITGWKLWVELGWVELWGGR